jgi:RNA polymerase sigma-70 factor (ECF subfamily)
MVRPPDSTSASAFDEVILAARAGSSDDLGRLLEVYRHYLLHIADSDLPGDLRGKVGGSDLVQETLVGAVRGFPQFQGSSEAELLTWLRQILQHNLVNAIRHYRHTEKRAVSREAATDPYQHDSPGFDRTPSSILAGQERDLALERALDQLPAHYQEVIRWRNYDQLSFPEIGTRLGRTDEAARRVWIRAIARLQELLSSPHE